MSTYQKKRNACIRLLIIVSCFAMCFGCKNENTARKDIQTIHFDKSIGTMGFNSVLTSLIDSFTVDLKVYKKITNIVGFIKICETTNNGTFKLFLAGIESDSLFKHLKVNDYFVKYHFLCGL